MLNGSVLLARGLSRLHRRGPVVAGITAVLLAGPAVAAQAQQPAVGQQPAVSQQAAGQQSAAGCSSFPWMDRSKSPDQRATLLLAQMTLDQKMTMLYSLSDAT